MRMYVAVAFLLVTTASLAADPTPEQVEAGVKKAVVFEVVPDLAGKATSCKYSMTQDRATNQPDPTFHPSDKYVTDACEKLRKRQWAVRRNTIGAVQPVYDYCQWSEVIPDNAICRVVPQQ
ncbi:hypothetical protein [Cognatilysobacter lacus]|uniref:Uncharacterized protein n=1 Tax=Cognatilysobacter lacus TaxID=1643323 RepID=A0A5D8YZF8_9GAMM|nr:hypothetical protein [Lysobacter lacus]TZF87780.1 hypothetical protein FW784_10675 [Lysobacter lacus]